MYFIVYRHLNDNNKKKYKKNELEKHEVSVSDLEEGN